MRVKPRPQIDWDRYEISEPPCEPERRLLMAILERAIRDALGIKANGWECNGQFAREARIWLRLEDGYKVEDDPELFGFQWVCSHLRVNAEYIHGQLRLALCTVEGQTALKDELYHKGLNRSFRLYN